MPPLTDIAEEIGHVIKGHIDSLPKLEQLVGRLEAAAKQLESVAELVAPGTAKIAARIEGDVAAGGAIADAAIHTAEEQTAGEPVHPAELARQAQAEASTAATRVAEEGSAEPSYTAAEWQAMHEAEASTESTRVPDEQPEPPAPTV